MAGHLGRHGSVQRRQSTGVLLRSCDSIALHGLPWPEVHMVSMMPTGPASPLDDPPLNLVPTRSVHPGSNAHPTRPAPPPGLAAATACPPPRHSSPPPAIQAASPRLLHRSADPPAARLSTLGPPRGPTPLPARRRSPPALRTRSLPIGTGVTSTVAPGSDRTAGPARMPSRWPHAASRSRRLDVEHPLRPVDAPRLDQVRDGAAVARPFH